MMRVAVVGGEPPLVNGNFSRKLNEKGVVVGWHFNRTATCLIPQACEGIVVITDMCSHNLSDSAIAQARKRELPYACVVRHWSKAEPVLRNAGIFRDEDAQAMDDIARQGLSVLKEMAADEMSIDYPNISKRFLVHGETQTSATPRSGLTCRSDREDPLTHLTPLVTLAAAAEILGVAAFRIDKAVKRGDLQQQESYRDGGKTLVRVLPLADVESWFASELFQEGKKLQDSLPAAIAAAGPVLSQEHNDNTGNDGKSVEGAEVMDSGGKTNRDDTFCLTISDVAAQFGVGVQFVAEAAKTGQLAYIRIRRNDPSPDAYRFQPKKVRDWMAGKSEAVVTENLQLQPVADTPQPGVEWLTGSEVSSRTGMHYTDICKYARQGRIPFEWRETARGMVRHFKWSDVETFLAGHKRIKKVDPAEVEKPQADAVQCEPDALVQVQDFPGATDVWHDGYEWLSCKDAVQVLGRSKDTLRAFAMEGLLVNRHESKSAGGKHPRVYYSKESVYRLKPYVTSGTTLSEIRKSFVAAGNILQEVWVPPQSLKDLGSPGTYALGSGKTVEQVVKTTVRTVDAGDALSCEPRKLRWVEQSGDLYANLSGELGKRLGSTTFTDETSAKSAFEASAGQIPDPTSLLGKTFTLIEIITVKSPKIKVVLD